MVEPLHAVVHEELGTDDAVTVVDVQRQSVDEARVRNDVLFVLLGQTRELLLQEPALAFIVELLVEVVSDRGLAGAPGLFDWRCFHPITALVLSS